MNTKEEDFVEHLFVTTTHEYILFFTDKGRMYTLKAYEVPEATRQARGTAVVNLVSLAPGETIRAVIPIRAFAPDRYLLMATRQGIVKKTPLSMFDKARRSGLASIDLAPGDGLVGVKLTSGAEEVIMVTSRGRSIRFAERNVRPMGRAARGVKGIALRQGDTVIGMDVVREGRDLLVVTMNGYGKRTPLGEYRSQSRGGSGILTLKVTPKNGPVVDVKVLDGDDELMMISAEGIVIRMGVSDIPQQGRSAQGVRVMKLEEGDHVVSIAQVSGKNGG